MKLNASKNMLTLTCAAIMSLSNLGSLSAQITDDSIEQNQVAKNSFKETMASFQEQIKGVKDPETARSLYAIHAAVSKVNKGSKLSQEDFKAAFSLLDEGITKFSPKNSPKVLANTSKTLSSLKRYVAKAHAAAHSKKKKIHAKSHHHSHHSHSSSSSSYSSDSHKHDLKPQCSKPIPINHVPVTITTPGKYCVTKNLIYRGSGDAITIAASNVTLNFENHDLVLTDPAATGVFAGDVTEITILNDKINLITLPALDTSAAIHFEGVTKGKIDNVYTSNTFFGVRIEGSSDIIVSNSHHKDHISDANSSLLPTAVLALDSSAVAIDSIVIEGNSGVTGFGPNGVAFRGACRGCQLTNSQIIESDVGVVAAGIKGLLIDNCSISSSPATFYSAIQVGRRISKGEDVHITNCTISNQYGQAGVNGIYLVNGSGCLIENVIIDTLTSTTDGAGIHIGLQGLAPYRDAIIRNTIVRNKNDLGIYIEIGSNCLIEDTEVSGSQIANIRLNQALDCTVRNCESNDATGIGIELTSNATRNAILSNVVNGNATGIYVAPGAQLNHFQNNNVFDNTGNGIDNGNYSNEFYGNTSCNNFGINCNSVFSDLFWMQNPGASPVVVGSNICCGSEQ